MTDIIEKTTTIEDSGIVASNNPAVVNQVQVNSTSSQTTRNLIYFFFGSLEILLAFRLILKLLGANVGSAFVNFIYGLSGLFVLPFEGIFRKGFSQGLETTSVLEPATLVALIVYAVVAWGIVIFAQVISGKQQTN